MSASVTNDKITPVRDTDNPTVTTVSTARSIGGTSLACASLSHWPTDAAVHFITYQKDPTTGLIDRTTQCDWKGTVSSNTISNLTLKNGTDAGNAVGAFVEMAPTAAYGQDLYDALTAEHKTTGKHSTVTFDSLTANSSSTVDFSGASSVNLPASSVTSANLGDSGWKTLTLTGSYSSTTTFQYRQIGSVVYLSGTIIRNSGNIPTSYEAIGTMPSGYRPSAYIRLPLAGYASGTAGSYILIINTDGTMTVAANGGLSATTVYITGLSFLCN